MPSEPNYQYSGLFLDTSPLQTDNLGSFGLDPSLRQAHGGQVRDFGITALIGTLVSIAASIGTTIWATKKQNQYNQETLDKQNEYNSPKKQMERLEEAGINPMAYLSQGGVSSGSSERLQKNAPDISMQTGALLNALSLASQVKVNEAQIRNLNASADLKAAQALTESARKNYYASSALKNDYWRTDYAPGQLRLIDARSQLTHVQIENLPKEIASRIDLNTATQKQKEALVERYKHLNDLSDQQVRESMKRVQWYQSMREKIAAEIPYINSLKDVADMKYVCEAMDVVIKSEMATLVGEKAQTWNWEKGSQIFKDIMSGLEKGGELFMILARLGIL